MLVQTERETLQAKFDNLSLEHQQSLKVQQQHIVELKKSLQKEIGVCLCFACELMRECD